MLFGDPVCRKEGVADYNNREWGVILNFQIFINKGNKTFWNKKIYAY